METIISKDNKRLKTVRKLFSSKSERIETGSFATEGVRLTTEVSRHGLKLLSLFVGESALGRYENSIKELEALADECFMLPDSLMNKLGDTDTPQGVIGVFEMPPEKSPPEEGPAIMLCHLQEPGNVGAILRSAAAFGLSVVLTPDCPDPYSPKVLRSSMGGVVAAEWSISRSPQDYISKRAMTGKVYAAILDNESARLGEAEIAGSLILIGNEGAGLSQDYIKLATNGIYIPIKPGAESLNASVAASIIAYELDREARLNA